MPAPDEGLPAGRLARQVVAPFAIPGGVSGTLTTTAYERDTTSLLGGVTVTYLLEVVDGPAGDSISRMSVGQVIGFATDVSIAHLDPGVTPAFIDRDVSGGFIGATFHTSPLDENANFLTPGFSAMLVVQSNAFVAWKGNAYLQGREGVVVPSMSFFAGAEPASWQLLAIGGVILVGLRQRRWTKN